MTNNRQKATHPEKTDIKKLPLLQKLQLEQLDGVVGGLLSDAALARDVKLI
ncbi:MAG: hypothetical protein QNJ72_17560 [Pleurocapsa sp. MO_226.B13]|nr:hypothetical protein [Pleurocapsa sp. MO_226.B13]